MKLTEIRQNTNKRFTTYIFRLMELIKVQANLPKNAKLYYLEVFNGNYYFCYKDTVFVTSCYTNTEPENDGYNIKDFTLTNLYSFTVLKDYPKTSHDVKTFELIHHDKYSYSIDNFLEWIDSPSQLTVSVDVPYYQVIKFLKEYKTSDFKSDKYIYYVKRDKEYCYCLHLYAKDIKNSKEIMLYIPSKSEYSKFYGWKDVTPDELKGVFAAADNVSKYQLTQVKKDFLRFITGYCPGLNCNNYFALELLKQATQPVELLHEWGIHRIFAGCDENKLKKFTNIWVEDIPNYREEPFFFLTNDPITWGATRVAAINFKSATYHTQFDTTYNIYKKGDVKYKLFSPDETYIIDLIEFLSSPAILEEYEQNKYGDLVHTNWQKLIFEYNYNSCEWGWGEEGVNEPLNENCIPFDLPMPDYAQLLK